MAIHLYRRTAQFPETWAEINRTTYGIGGEQLKIGYDGPSSLSFTLTAANHTIPFDAYATFLKWWDDTGTLPDDTPQDEDHPAFEGWVEEITPGDETNEVSIVAYDPTFRAARLIVCMSEEWELDPDDDKQFPVDGNGAYPRVVVNAHNDTDPDWTYSIAQNLSLGQIIRLILDHQYLPLLHCSAAPGDGTTAGNQLPYDPEELGPSWESSSSGSSSGSSSSGAPLEGRLSFVPLEKVIFHSDSPRSAIERLLQQWAPEFKMYWEPGSRLWRFVKMTEAEEVTVTWNDLDEPYIPFGIDVRRSSDGKYGAIKFYGPEGREWREFTWTNPDIESSGVSNTLESIDPTITDDGEGHAVKCHHTFQITDPTFTKMMARGATSIGVPSILGIQQDESGNIVGIVGGNWVETWGPQILVRFEPGSAGDDGFLPVSAWKCDFREGVVRFGATCLFRRNVGASGGEPQLQEPWQVRLVTPCLTQPISVRYPAAGYTGTAASIGGIQAQSRLYDEQLAVGIVYGVPTTTPLRLSRFRQLARLQHDRLKDLDHVGTVIFDGLDYRWLFLNKRTNLAAKGDDGNPLSTGWENIGAFVTGVEYDVENCQTTISFSDDRADVLGLDLNMMKNRLKIRSAKYNSWFNVSVFFAYKPMKSGTGYRYLGQDTTLVVEQGGEFRDEQGERQ